MNKEEFENEINKEEKLDIEQEPELQEIDIVDLLRKCRAGGENKFLTMLMEELEWAEDTLFDANLSAANYIYYKTRYETLKEIKNKYCDYLAKNKEK